MGFLDWFSGLFSRGGQRRPLARGQHPGRFRAMAGGRASRDRPDQFLGSLRTILAPADAESDWRTLGLDASTLDRMAPAQLVEVMADLSPEIALAIWQFQRFCNPGHTITALKAASDDPDAQGQAIINAFLARLDGLYGTRDVVIGRLFLGPFLRGGFFAELVLDQLGRTMIDLATPDPLTARFRPVDDPERGQVWQLGQQQLGEFQPLDRETIRYIPLDPLPGSPYGRALVAPAIFSALFMLGVLHDLRRVVMQQGWPRLDMEVDIAELLKTMPDGTDDMGAWMEDEIASFRRLYAELEPDDAYFHASHTKVNRPVGAVDSSSLGAIDPLLKALERFLARSLKTMPMLMGISEGTSEANANRQYEIAAAGFKSIQHYAETLLGGLLTIGLRAAGSTARVKVMFAELRAAEMMRDAQTEALIITNATNKYLMGWISHEQAAKEGAKVHAPALPAPLAVPAASPAAGLGTINPEPGSNRDAEVLAQLAHLLARANGNGAKVPA